MPSSQKTFRIFVSSTFSDFKAERNALQEKVFPELRKLCEANGCRFQAVDLRWGVSEEAALDQQTMNICLTELKRCQVVSPRPNFIILLGDRYGWMPLPPQVEASEFEEILSHIKLEDRKLLKWDETLPDGGGGWYRLDKNAVQPEYVLRSRRAEVFAESDYAFWGKTEERLRAILCGAINSLGWPENDERRIKYECSATHQEIIEGALKLPDDPSGREHVFAFFRNIQNLDNLSPDSTYVDAGVKKAQALKEKISRTKGVTSHSYDVTWSGQELKAHLDQFAADVLDSLRRIIEEEFRELQQVDDLTRENIAHAEFGAERCRHFVGRQKILDDIAAHISDGQAAPLVVYGLSGSGKSALMAKAAVDAAHNEVPASVAPRHIIQRFIGATPESTDIRTLLRNLCLEIYQEFEFDRFKEEELADVTDPETRAAIIRRFEIPEEYQHLSEKFRTFLIMIPGNRRLLIFLDALDQLNVTDNAHSLSWLPSWVAPNVNIIVSVLERDDNAGECLKSARTKLDKLMLLHLEDMTPEEGEQVLRKWLLEAYPDKKRTLTDEQIKSVLAGFRGCPQPLYLKLAFEEARRWKSYERLPRGAGDIPGLAGDIPGIIQDLFWRLQQASQHGKVLVERVLGYLAAARKGLTEDEIIDLLWEKDKEMRADFLQRSPKSPETNQMPIIIWSRLFMDLEPYLSERNADDVLVLGFYHRQVREAANKYFLQGDAKRRRHEALANKFEKMCKGDGNNYLPIKRPISEFAYHYRLCIDTKKLEDIYSNMSYVCNYVKCHNAFDLKQEILLVQDSCIDNEVRSFINNTAFILAKNPEQAPQLIYKEMENVSFREQAEILAVHPWIKADNIHFEKNTEEKPISVIPILSEEMRIQASCVAQKANIAFVNNASDKIELLSTDDMKPIGEISLTTKPPITIKKLLCDRMGKLLTLVYDNGCIEVLRIIYNQKGSILATKCVHTGVCVTGKFGSISVFSSLDEIIYQNSDRQIVILKIDEMGEILPEYLPPESKTLMNYFGNDVRCFAWKDKNEHLLVVPELNFNIKTAYKVLAVSKFGDRLIVSTEESKLLIYKSSDSEIERDIPNRLPIISICLTNSDILLMTDRHGNILSLDNNLNLIEHGRCSQDLYDDYPSAVYFTGNAGLFYISQRRCVSLSLSSSNINNVMMVDGEKEHPNILKYSRSNGFELSIGGRAFRQLKQDIIRNRYEFEFTNFKVAWSPGGTVAYTKKSHSVTLENSKQSKSYETKSEIVKIMYYEKLESFLVLCYSGELYFVGINDQEIVPFKVPLSNTGNYLMEICGVYVCIVSKNVLCSSSSTNTYSESVLSLYYPFQSDRSTNLDVINCQHIDNNKPHILSISYNQEVNSLYLYREGILERWQLDNPKENKITLSYFLGDRNTALPFCAYKNGCFFVSTTNKLKLQTMQSIEATTELSSFRTITFLSQTMGKYGYFVENNQKIYSFSIREN